MTGKPFQMITHMECLHLDNHNLINKQKIVEKKTRQCSECSFSCESTSELNNHRRSNHEENPAEIQCVICNFKGKNNVIIQEHKKNSHEYDKYEKMSGREEIACDKLYAALNVGTDAGTKKVTGNRWE